MRARVVVFFPLLSDPILLQLHVIVAGHHPAPQGSNDTVKEGGGGDGGTCVGTFETDAEECCQTITRVQFQALGSNKLVLHCRIRLLFKSPANNQRS